MDGPAVLQFCLHEIRNELKSCSGRIQGEHLAIVWGFVPYKGTTDLDHIAGSIDLECREQALFEKLKVIFEKTGHYNMKETLSMLQNTLRIGKVNTEMKFWNDLPSRQITTLLKMVVVFL